MKKIIMSFLFLMTVVVWGSENLNGKKPILWDSRFPTKVCGLVVFKNEFENTYNICCTMNSEEPNLYPIKCVFSFGVVVSKDEKLILITDKLGLQNIFYSEIKIFNNAVKVCVDDSIFLLVHVPFAPGKYVGEITVCDGQEKISRIF